MRKLIIASNNKNKIKEIKEILGGLNIDVIALKETGMDIEVEETGDTFIENAYIKASEIFKLFKEDNCMVLADDSGLSVEALGGQPGIYSARFAGEHGNDRKNNEKLLNMMKDVENRKGKFICAMALIIDENNIIKVQGEVEGVIGYEEKGVHGFGYDPLFYYPKHNMTFGEMDGNLKNNISHRRIALNELEKKIKEYFQGE
ncbi:XTP/dITP diphosphatase [uncultured Clostridium sp.]|uniref:XTP/dITP diphosphatase n=1 Tax=uncultured Clostridium sp. TaxID=59620 RepID=UPI0028EDCB36|nr:XTP/dITP diphosphatase [uncultured Clostridium sp.]